MIRASLPPPDEKQEEFMPPIVEGFDFGTSLQQVYPILGIIFRHLQSKDLNNAAQVNNIWLDYSRKELSSRRLCGQFNIYYKKAGMYDVEKSKDFGMVNGQCTLLFGTKYLQRYIAETSKEVSPLFMHIVKDKLFDLTHMDCYGYVVRNTIPVYGTKCCSGFVIPKIDDIVVRVYGKDFRDEINLEFKKGLEVKAIIYLRDKRTESNNVICTNLKHIYKYQNEKKFALAGGLIIERMDETFERDALRLRYLTNNKNGSLYAFTFLSPVNNTNFEAYSILIDDEHLFTNKLQELKTEMHGKNRKYWKAFLFYCSKHVYKCAKIEKRFGDIFPTIPVTSVSVDGEIGWDSFGTDTIDDQCVEGGPSKKVDVLPEFWHIFSVAVMVLSWS